MKKILKEWFPNKEELRSLEDLAKTQKQIYSDAADYGLDYTPELHKKIQGPLYKLKDTYGFKIDKWKGGASYSIFIPIERADYEPEKDDGIVIVVSLNVDPIRKKKFFSIDIGRKTLSQQEAKRDYGSIFYDKQESVLAEAKLRNIIREAVETEILQAVEEKPQVKEQSSDNEFTSNVEVEFDKDFLLRYNIVPQVDDNTDIHLVDEQKVALTWKIDYDYRSWGIKSIYPMIPDQKIKLYFEQDFWRDDREQETFEKEIEIKDANIKIEPPEEMDSSFKLYPYKIEFYRGRAPLVYFTL